MPELSLAALRGSLLELRLLDQPVIVHASLRAFGYIQGGADTMVRALVETTAGVVAPAFTYKTMITPEVGPPNNGIRYGSELHRNSLAESFRPDMPADPLMGILAEAVRSHPAARRTSHPILSFAGIHAEAALEAQTLFNPFAPIGVLAEQDGWVLLLGTDHTVNTTIHYGETLAGRRQFVRWALLKNRIVECPGYPGDSSGFTSISPDLEGATRRVQAGRGTIQAVPIRRVLEATQARLKKDPLDLLCRRRDCERCNTIREGEGGRLVDR